MRLFFDTNVWVRYFIGDNKKVRDDCIALFKAADQGKIKLYLSTIVLLEIYWVLQSVYGKTKAQSADIIESVAGTRGLVIIERTLFRQAFDIHKKTGVKLADCLIATQVGKGIMLVTYDREFRKLPGLTVVEPGDVLRVLKK